MTDWQVFASLTRFEMCFVVIINDVFFIKIWRGLTGRKCVITFENLLGPNPEDKNNRDIKIFFPNTCHNSNSSVIKSLLLSYHNKCRVNTCVG